MRNSADRHAQLSRYRRLFHQDLSLADDMAMLRMIWALNALQTGRADGALPFLSDIPDGAASEDIPGPHAIYPWELETLANELLSIPKHRFYRVSDTRKWGAARRMAGLLRAIENDEYALRDERDIFLEMGRIGARQFPWQRGYCTVQQFYRSAYLYGQGEAAAFFRETVGLDIAEMILVGFALYSVFHDEPSLRPRKHLALLDAFGVKRADLARALDRIAAPLADARGRAADLRRADGAIAYKPSLLRDYPCLLTGPRNRMMIAPLPDLIMDRVTTGLFYDVIDGGGPVRDEIGHRFEAYAIDLLRAMLASTRFRPETSYRTRLGPVDSPDILMMADDDAVGLAIECKAVRMTIAARFGTRPGEARGYDEIAKGVMQLWRFFAHCRQGRTGCTIRDDALGLLLTLDEWFAGRSSIIAAVLERAHELADASAHNIPAEDRRAVAFCTISELETALVTATPASLLDTVRIAATDRQGWIFSSLHADCAAPKAEPRPWPFDDELQRLLPWYDRLATMAEGAD